MKFLKNEPLKGLIHGLITVSSVNKDNKYFLSK